MEKCKYGRNGTDHYYYYEDENPVKYICPRDALLDRSYCKFHDIDNSRNNPREVLNSFYVLVTEALQASVLPGFCIALHWF